MIDETVPLQEGGGDREPRRGLSIVPGFGAVEEDRRDVSLLFTRIPKKYGIECD